VGRATLEVGGEPPRSPWAQPLPGGDGDAWIPRCTREARSGHPGDRLDAGVDPGGRLRRGRAGRASRTRSRHGRGRRLPHQPHPRRPCTEVFPVPRTVDADDPVTGALEALLAGPPPPRSTRLRRLVLPVTADALLDVAVDDGGTVHVVFTDLRELIPNASSSCGSAGLLAQLDRTLTALDGVDATRYALADQAAFYGGSSSTQRPRADPRATPRARATHRARGCGRRHRSRPRHASTTSRQRSNVSWRPRPAIRRREVTCDAAGAARPGDVFVCSVVTVPPEPTGEWGTYVVAVLDEDTVVRVLRDRPSRHDGRGSGAVRRCDPRSVLPRHPPTRWPPSAASAPSRRPPSSGRSCTGTSRASRPGWTPTATGSRAGPSTTPT
jgi:hypothetical protein